MKRSSSRRTEAGEAATRQPHALLGPIGPRVAPKIIRFSRFPREGKGVAVGCAARSAVRDRPT